MWRKLVCDRGIRTGKTIAATPHVIAGALILFMASVGVYVLAKADTLRRTSGIWLTIAYFCYAAWVVVR